MFEHNIKSLQELKELMNSISQLEIATSFDYFKQRIS